MSLPATDNFDRADGGVGANWTNLVDAWLVVSNGVKSTTDSSVPLAMVIWTADEAVPGQYTQLRMSNISTECLTPAVRASAGNNAYYLSLHTFAEPLWLYCYVAGALTGVQSITAAPLIDGDVLKIAIDVDGRLRVFVNGTQIGYDQVDETLTGGTWGMVAFDNTGVGDDFECGEWTTAGSTQALSIVSIMPALEL